MSVRRVLLGSLLLSCSVAVVADEELPEIEFIEYLGLWEGNDEDWIMFSDAIRARNEKRSDPAPEGEESTENDDEP